MSARLPAMGPATVLVIAQELVAGRVKTRLTPPCTPHEAAALAAAALADTLHTVLGAPARRRVLVLDGAAGPSLPPGFDIVPQKAGGLEEQIAAAFAHCDRGPALLIGMDTPPTDRGTLRGCRTRRPRRLVRAGRGRRVPGAGSRRPGARGCPPRGVPMSCDRTRAMQRCRLVEAGLRVGDLPVLRDVDTAADAAAVATRCPPGSRFAAAVKSFAEAGR